MTSPRRPPPLLLGRRDLLRLAAAAGASALLPGCPAADEAAPARPFPPPCRIHGQDDALGHMLREGSLRGRRVDREERPGILVIGAGVAGLSCAWRLRREGVEDVLLLDAGRAPGGNARWGENEVSRYPWGAHYLRVPTREHPALETFLDEAGLLRGRDARGAPDWDTRAVCVAPLERLYERGLWGEGLVPPLSGDPALEAELERFQAEVARWGAWRDADGRRAFAIPVERSSRDPALLALDRRSFAAWLDEQGYAHPALRWQLDYACRDDYGCSAAATSAWAGLHYFAARWSDEPGRDAILTWPEGNGRLVQLLARVAGEPPLRTRALCCGIDPEEPSARVHHAEQDELVLYRPRRLVWAGPRFVLARLLEAPPADASAFSYSPWLVVNATLDRPPGGVGAGLAWDNVFYGAPSLGYVVANRPGPGARGPCLVTWYRPFAELEPGDARRALLALDEAAIREQVLAELLAVHPDLRGRVRGLDAWRWGHALVRPTPGFLWGPERAAAQEPIGQLVCANSDLSGLPLFEEAFFQGVRAGEELLRREGRSFASLLQPD